MVFEADFRFHEADCIPPEEWLPMLSTPQRFDGTRGSPYYGVVPWTRPSGSEPAISPELFDLVAMCNQAQRLRTSDGDPYGDIIWFGWNGPNDPKKGKRKQPLHTLRYGTQGMAFTKQGAESLLAHMRHDPPDDLDMYLKELFRQKKIRGCQVVPPLGGFIEHPSPNIQGQIRQSHWRARWARPGSGRELGADGSGRHFWPLGSEAYPIEIRYDLGRHMVHKTQRPPLSTDGDATMVNLLRRCQWLSDHGEYIGPPTGRRWTDRPAEQRLCWEPDVVRQPVAAEGFRGDLIGLTTLQEALVVLHPLELRYFCTRRVTDRWARRYQQFVQRYRRRAFAEPDEEA